MMKKVPLTEAEKKTPYYKYFVRDLTPIPAEKLAKLTDNKLSDETALLIDDKDRMFDPDFKTEEIGWAILSNKSAIVQNVTPMPGVTPEMFDWWFAWHGLEPMRYKIWDSEDHYYCQTRDPEISSDTSLSMKERYWNTTHDVLEDAGGGDLLGRGPVREHIVISFQNPLNLGFDEEKWKAFDGTIVCAADAQSPVVMCHFLKRTPEGSELHTHFWMGYSLIDGKIVKLPLPEEVLAGLGGMAKGLFAHNIKEFTHLAAILPELYNEFGQE